MVLTNKSRKAFKAISSLMAGIFLFEQIALAGDLINVALAICRTSRRQPKLL
jgi:hypothetical protein